MEVVALLLSEAWFDGIRMLASSLRRISSFSKTQKTQ